MKDISEMLNQLVDFSFHIEDEKIATNVLLLEGRGEVVFKCRVETALYKKIALLDTFFLSLPITIFHLKKSSSQTRPLNR